MARDTSNWCFEIGNSGMRGDFTSVSPRLADALVGATGFVSGFAPPPRL
jgi:hypothetical protein